MGARISAGSIAPNARSSVEAWRYCWRPFRRRRTHKSIRRMLRMRWKRHCYGLGGFSTFSLFTLLGTNQLQTERWLALQRARLLACDHYHVIFTLPHDLNALWLAHV